MSEASPDETARSVRFDCNGRSVELDVNDFDTVAEVVRERLGLTGTKVSCDEQICGACTVLVDDLPVSACTTLAAELDGRTVTTIEGLRRDDGTLHPLQQAFIDEFAFQCGFCTPGMIMSALALLREKPDAQRDDIVAHLDGTICRCTGYVPIVNAVLTAQRQLTGGTP